MTVTETKTKTVTKTATETKCRERTTKAEEKEWPQYKLRALEMTDAQVGGRRR